VRARILTLVLAGAVLAAIGPADAAPTPVKDGRYAGGAKGLLVFFDVESRTIPFARVVSDRLGPCTGINGPAVFDSDTVDSDGRFSLKDSTTFPGNTLKVAGRFTTSTHVKGKVKWTTTSDCPADTYKFDYRADRYASVG
jgi:hypothetical protein